MVNAKAIVLLIVASVLVAAVVGIAFAQYANAQSTNNTSQAPQVASGSTYTAPQQGYYPYGPAQNGYGYGGHGYGSGNCGCFW